MASSETPAPASPSRGQALQLEATNASEDLKDIDIGLDEPRDARRDDPLETLNALDDPEGKYRAQLAPDCIGQNAPVPDSAHVFQTGNSTDEVIKINCQVLEFVPKEDHCYPLTSENVGDRLEDCDTNYNIKGVDEDDQADGKSSDQNISVLGTKATDKAESATLSEKRLQEDFSPTATTPSDVSVLELTTSSSEPLLKPEEVEEEGVSVDDVDHTSFSVELDPDSQKTKNPVGTELVTQTEDGVNLQVTVHDKEDEMNGKSVLDKMNEGGTNKPFVSTFDAISDRPAPATGDTSPTTPNDVRLAVPSLEPLPKREKVNEEGILVIVKHTSSSSSAASL